MYYLKERAKTEMNEEGSSVLNRPLDMVIQYLPSVVITLINLISQFIFAYIRELKLYTRTTAIRHYLIR